VLSLTPVPGPVRAAGALPLLLFLPGYALTAALFVPGGISRELRVVLGIAFSLGAAALGGLVVQLVLRLDRPVWAALLALVTVLAAIAALRGREPSADRLRPGPGLPRIGLASLATILAAMAVAGGAIAIATQGVHRQVDRSHFTSLSLVPSDPSTTASPVRIGVSNHEGRAVAYRLVVRRWARTIQRWRFRLQANQDWEAQLPAPAVSGTDPLVAVLDRDGRPYHRVALQIGSNG